MSKALLIQSYTSLTTGTQGIWNPLTMATSYIQGIQTGDILGTINAQTLNALISGVPSPWARAKLFKYALETLNNPNPNIKEGGLLKFYDILYGEWRGLLAVMALYQDRIRFSKPLSMNRNGEDYEIAASFGRMLFDDWDVWCNQEALDKNPDEQPFIQLIYYRDQLVGGTSPYTGVFTGVDYARLESTASDIRWYRNGKFEDPTSYLEPQQLQKVYLFVKNINSRIEDFEKAINKHRANKEQMDISGFKGMCRRWEDELSEAGKGRLRNIGPIANYQMQYPFSKLFESNVPVYLKKDYTFTYENDGESKEVGDIQGLLSKDDYVIGWVDAHSQAVKLSEAPVYFLSYKDIESGDVCYFSIPLSEKGIDIFKNHLGGILGYSPKSNARLTARITDGGLLAVSFEVEIDGEKVLLNDREYNISWRDDEKRVIVWPNFVSQQWSRYYLFSEFTEDAKEQFVPVFRLGDDIIKNAEGAFFSSKDALSSNEAKEVEVKRLVSYPSGVGDNLPKYNILRTNKPIFGLRASVKVGGKSMGAGFLIVDNAKVKDLSTVTLTSSAKVGIDFGSNNTCVFYNPEDRGAMPIQFGNYRAVLVGRENDNPRALAENNELLFFTNYPSSNGQLKSWLHEHDSRYVEHTQSEEVSGGVPVNKPNVRVEEMNEYEIKTQAGILHYNMKWLNNEKGCEKKRAFLKSIWLQSCAFLYTQRIKSESIRWSFPGSMMEPDRDELQNIYESLCKSTPYDKAPKLEDRITEAEAVCNFALSRDFGLTGNNLFLGIDVGGSTSDILLLAKDPESNKNALFRESSVRLAAGVFFNAVIQSEQFRQALVTFHEGKNTAVYVENIKEILTHPKKAPYYLNSIFDQLKTNEEYDTFYEALAANAKFVFTIPAYVCGLLLFYSGILIGKTIKDRKLDNLSKVDVLPFGKGGRIFHWLRHATSERTTGEFYANCVNAGIKCILPEKEMQITYRNEIESDTKTEVAHGLCDMRKPENLSPQNDTDVCGETGVRFMSTGGSKNIEPDEELSGEYFAEDMCNFDFTGVQNFEKYIKLFIEFVSQKTKLYAEAEDLRSELNDIPSRIVSFCTRDEEYKKASKSAKQGHGFHYHQPIIVAEGACFLEMLVKKVFSR